MAALPFLRTFVPPSVGTRFTGSPPASARAGRVGIMSAEAPYARFVHVATFTRTVHVMLDRLSLQSTLPAFDSSSHLVLATSSQYGHLV